MEKQWSVFDNAAIKKRIEKIKEEQLKYNYCMLNITFEDTITDTILAIQTPYLSKDDIEKEGWTLEYGLVDHLYFTKGCSTLIFFERGYKIEIQHPTNLVVYNGSCPSVNELRYISKLLNI